MIRIFALFLKNFSLNKYLTVLALRLFFAFENWFDLLKTSGHIDVLVYDLKASHHLHFSIPELLVCDCVWNVCQMRGVGNWVLEILMLGGRWWTMATIGDMFVRWAGGLETTIGTVLAVLDAHEIEQVLRVGLALQPQLILLHRTAYYGT